jgi:hypothetical protein
VRAALRAVIDAAGPDLPALLAELEEARATVWRWLREDVDRPGNLKLLSIDEAAELARTSRRRLFSLARAAGWSVRVGRRLLVDELQFRRWLRARAADVRGGHEAAPGASACAAQARSCTPVTRRRD